MRKPASLAVRLSGASAAKKFAKPVQMNEIAEGTQNTAAYIAELTGELRVLANGAHIARLAQLLARVQLEAELWSRQRLDAANPWGTQ